MVFNNKLFGCSAKVILVEYNSLLVKILNVMCLLEISCSKLVTNFSAPILNSSYDEKPSGTINTLSGRGADETEPIVTTLELKLKERFALSCLFLGY